MSPLIVAADPAEYDAFAGSGAAELRGQAFLVTDGGEVKHAAGRVVTLDPATRYARQWFRRYGADAEYYQFAAPDSQFRLARRTAVAEAEGRFRFGRLMPGPYIVRSVVTWAMEEDSVEQGGVVGALVKLEEGETGSCSGGSSRRIRPRSW